MLKFILLIIAVYFLYRFYIQPAFQRSGNKERQTHPDYKDEYIDFEEVDD